MPKGLLLIFDKPLNQFAADEAIVAVIDTLIVVTGWNKCEIEDHFDANSSKPLISVMNVERLYLEKLCYSNR